MRDTPDVTLTFTQLASEGVLFCDPQVLGSLTQFLTGSVMFVPAGEMEDLSRCLVIRQVKLKVLTEPCPKTELVLCSDEFCSQDVLTTVSSK